MNKCIRRYFLRDSIAVVACMVMAVGCGQSHRVEPDLAVKTLRSTMESWKSGQAPGDLQKASPPVVVQDMDWMAGAKLLDFEILEGGNPVDANLYAQVKLKLRDSAGSESEKTVTYVVGTSPKLTVFRDMFR